jgi:hypothetical protein
MDEREREKRLRIVDIPGRKLHIVSETSVDMTLCGQYIGGNNRPSEYFDGILGYSHLCKYCERAVKRMMDK